MASRRAGKNIGCIIFRFVVAVDIMPEEVCIRISKLLLVACHQFVKPEGGTTIDDNGGTASTGEGKIVNREGNDAENEEDGFFRRVKRKIFGFFGSA